MDTVFSITKRTPSGASAQAVVLAKADLGIFLGLFRSTDWRLENNRSFWRHAPAPRIEVRNDQTESLLWVFPYDLVSHVKDNREPTEGLLLDFVIGLDDENHGFFAGTSERVEAAFGSFFNERLEELQAQMDAMVKVDIVK